MRRTDFTCPSGARLIATELGFGGAPLGNLLAPLSDATAEATLQASWDAGMRWFDTAPLYGLGLSEERVGRFFQGAARGEATISTKVGRVLEDCAPEDATPDKFIDVPSRRFDFDYGYDGVMRSYEQSLARMGVEAVDVLFCHDVDVFTHGSEAERDRRIKAFLDGGLRAMLELREQGAVKAIGAGINEWQAARLLAEAADVDVFLLAGRYTLLEQTALESFMPFCERRGIGILLGGPFNSGVLATGAVEGALYDYAPAPPEVLARVARIERVCAAHGVALPAAALRFPLAHPQVFSIIPGTRTPEETARAVETLQADIPAGLWSDLRAEGLIREDAPTPEAAS